MSQSEINPRYLQLTWEELMYEVALNPAISESECYEILLEWKKQHPDE